MLTNFRRLLTKNITSLKPRYAFSNALDRHLKAPPSKEPPVKMHTYRNKKNEVVIKEERPFELRVPEVMDYEEFSHAILQTTDSKQLKKVPTSELIEVNKYIMNTPESPISGALWAKLEGEYKKRIDSMELKDIAEILWLYAYTNRKNPKFFKVLEDGIFGQDYSTELDYRLIKKILWGFSHANYGSSVLYSTIANQVKKIHMELDPTLLAEYAYYFSKASNSMKGGFGMYQIAETKIQERLRDFDLLQLRRICEYLLPQNIGSNKFYQELEERLEELYPKDVAPSVLVSLCKSTFNFRFKTKLFSKFEKNVLEYMQHFSNSQLEEILWSFAKGKRGSEEFYTAITEEFVKRMNVLKPRGVAFSFLCFANMGKGSYALFQKYQEYILKNIENFSAHYLAKLLVGLSKINPEYYSAELVETIFNKVDSVKGEINSRELLRILESMQGLTLTLKNVDWDAFYTNIESIIIENVRKATPEDAVQFLFSYISSNQGSPELIQALQDKIGTIHNIPKNVFCEGFFSYIEVGDLDIGFDFIPIIEELCGYGHIKFFFDHENFIRLVWGVASLIHADPEIMGGLQKFAYQNTKESLLEINLNTLRQDTIKLYLQTFSILKSLGALEEAEEISIYQKFEELTVEQRNELIENDPSSKSNVEIKEQILESVNRFVEEKDLKLTLVRDMSDEFYNIIDAALINEETLDKYGVLLLNKHHHLKCRDYKEKTFVVQNKVSVLKSLGWNLVEINEDKYKALDEKARNEFIQKKLQQLIFENQNEKQEEKQEEHEEKTSTKKAGRGRRRERNASESEDEI